MAATIEPIALDDLVAVAGFDRGSLISLVGGGGKTTTLFALGRQLNGATALTTTTKMGSDRTDGLPLLIAPSDPELCAAVEAGPTLVWSDATGHRATGVLPDECDRWFSKLDPVENVVVEADGSRRRPFKAPADHEPVVPALTTTLIACIGVGALERPIAERCHRPELVAVLANCSPHDALTAERAAAVLLNPEGSRKGCSSQARFIIAVCGVTRLNNETVERLADCVGDTELIAIAPTS